MSHERLLRTNVHFEIQYDLYVFFLALPTEIGNAGCSLLSNPRAQNKSMGTD